MLAEITFNTDRMEGRLSQGFITATDCADYLVGKGMNFRDAHETVGRIVHGLEKEGKGFADLSRRSSRNFSALFDRDITRILTVEASVEARSVFGGTAPERVAEMIERAASIDEKSDMP